MSENRTRFRLDQRRAPIYEALERFRQMRVVPFDVPGHKRGRGNPELTAFLGQQCVGVDVNSMKPLDNLCHPVSVIREAEELAADAFGAAHAFLMVGGTTSSVQSMVLTACKRGDEIILPRNVHRSVLNALVLCGAVPVYVNPEVDKRLGISLGMKREQVEKAIKEHPNAVAVLVNNPTYYGICSDLRAIVKMAHDAGMLCLADEAHGTHFYFGGGLPVSAMAAGGVRLHAQERRQPHPVQPAAHRAQRASGLCAADHQPDPDHLRQLPAHVQPGHLPPQSGIAGAAGVPSGGRHGRVCPRGDQRRGRLLRLWQGAVQRQLGVRL